MGCSAVESTVGLEKLVEDEDKERGNVSASVYKQYIVLGGVYACIGVAILMLLGQVGIRVFTVPVIYV